MLDAPGLGTGLAGARWQARCALGLGCGSLISRARRRARQLLSFDCFDQFTAETLSRLRAISICFRKFGPRCLGCHLARVFPAAARRRSRSCLESFITRAYRYKSGESRKRKGRNGIFRFSQLSSFALCRSRTKMTRRSKPASSVPAPPAGPSAQELASHLGGLALGSGNQPQPPSAENGAAAALSAAKGAASSDAGPSSSVPSSSATSLSAVGPPGGSHNVSSPPAPAGERKACACCLVVIAGKVFFCSRCHLVTYCGKDCQARTCPIFPLSRARLSLSSTRLSPLAGLPCAREFFNHLLYTLHVVFFFRSPTGAPRTRSCAASPKREGRGPAHKCSLGHPGQLPRLTALDGHL